MINSPLQAMPIREFAISRGFTQVSPAVRTNVNGYPYVTFIDQSNVAENVYFSKKASERVTAGTAVDKQLLSQHQIAITHNAEGEERVKLISNSERVNLMELL